MDKNAGTLYVTLTRSTVNSVDPGTVNNLGAISALFATNMAAPGPGIAGANDFAVATAAGFLPTWLSQWAASWTARRRHHRHPLHCPGHRQRHQHHRT